MKWLKLADGGLFNLESVSYVYVNGDYAAMIAGGVDDWSISTVREVWAVLDRQNTACYKCGVYFEPRDETIRADGGLKHSTC